MSKVAKCSWIHSYPVAERGCTLERQLRFVHPWLCFALHEAVGSHPIPFLEGYECNSQAHPCASCHGYPGVWNRIGQRQYALLGCHRRTLRVFEHLLSKCGACEVLLRCAAAEAELPLQIELRMPHLGLHLLPTGALPGGACGIAHGCIYPPRADSAGQRD